MNIPITLGLPPLSPGAEPPAECPHCGAIGGAMVAWMQYGCSAWYATVSRQTSPMGNCTRPRASAVLSALRERMGFADANNCGVSDAETATREMERDRGLLPKEAQ